MQPLTPDRLAANAFRTLGLGGGAAQADVEAAARRMRIWPDPSRVPPTPWDVPALGPVARGRGDVEAAVERLRRPGSRLEDRVAWYAGPPPAGEPSSAVGDPGPTPDVDPAAAHDAAVAALHAAWAADPAVADAGRWADVMRRLAGLAASGAYAGWLSAAEAAGGFDVGATPAEVAAAARAAPAALAEALAGRARDALNRGDTAACGRIGAVVRAAGPDAARAVDGLLDGVEDLLHGHCRTLDEKLRDVLRTDADGSDWYVRPNRNAAQNAETVYLALVKPALDALAAMADPGDDRLARASDRCAELLTLVALGWEWGNRMIRAEQTLDEALRLAGDSPAAWEARRAMDRVRPLADDERASQRASFELGSSPVSYAGGAYATTPYASAAAAAAAAAEPAEKRFATATFSNAPVADAGSFDTASAPESRLTETSAADDGYRPDDPGTWRGYSYDSGSDWSDRWSTIPTWFWFVVAATIVLVVLVFRADTDGPGSRGRSSPAGPGRNAPVPIPVPDATVVPYKGPGEGRSPPGPPGRVWADPPPGYDPWTGRPKPTTGPAPRR